MAEQIVRNSTELAAAVADMNIDVIFFSANIELTSPITIPANKTTLVFDGLYEGAIHSFTDMDSNQLGDTLHISGASSISLTFQNMNITGRNYYGIPYISESGTSNVSITYRNISYVGSQLVYHTQGLTRFENVDITISSSSASPAEEVGEVCRVEFSGTNNIIRHYSTTDAVFWFRGPANAAYFRLMPDSRLSVDTVNYFMYSSYLLTQYPVAYDIQQGASFTLNSNHGISYNYYNLATTFLVGTNASFRYIQEAPNGTSASLYLSGSFTVNQGASVYMQADFANAYPFLNFSSGSGTLLSVNNPKSFVMYSRSSVPLTMAALTTRTFTITSEQLNHWTTALAFPAAGTFSDIAQNRWHNTDWAVFTVNGNVTSSATTPSSSGLVITQPPIANFSFQSARVISAGSLTIEPDPVIDSGRPITGLTEPNANLVISYTVESTPYSFTLTAEEDGRFELDPEMLLPVGTIVSFSANTPFLIKDIETTVVPTGEVSITYAPPFIVFRPPPVSTNPVLLGRTNPRDPVEVYDSRPYTTQWRLLASISGPLEAASGEVLQDAVVFKDNDEMLWDLGTTPIVVHTDGPREGLTEVTWTEDKGILCRLTQPIRSGAAYTTQLIWMLEVVEV